MKQYQLNNLMDELIQPLFGFSYILTGDRILARELLMDAYTVYLVREKRFLQKKDIDPLDKIQRRAIKKFLYHELLGETLELAMKRAPESTDEGSYQVDSFSRSPISEEYKCFFSMGVFPRAIFYLKEVKGFSIEDLQEIFGLERHRTLEFYYNARQMMVGDIESLYREGDRA